MANLQNFEKSSQSLLALLQLALVFRNALRVTPELSERVGAKSVSDLRSALNFFLMTLCTHVSDEL